jgi:hypothetical protein
LAIADPRIPAEDYATYVVHGYIINVSMPDSCYNDKGYIASQADIVDRNGDLLRVILTTPEKEILKAGDLRPEFKTKFPFQKYVLLSGLPRSADKFAASDTLTIGYQSSIICTTNISSLAPDLVDFKPITVSPQYAISMPQLLERGRIHMLLFGFTMYCV